MSKTALSLIGVVVVAGVATSVVIHQSSQAEVREKAEAARRQAEQITQLSADNERLSNQVARTGNLQPLSPDELSELLRLRGQLGRLRQIASERARLEAANQQLRAAQAGWEQQLAAARAAPNFWPKEQLAFYGYADPEAALRTSLWAMNKGDVKAYLACWAAGPDVNVAFSGQFHDKADAELAAAGKVLAENLTPSIGFHILDKNQKSADEVVLNLSFDGEGKARKFVMKRTGNEWKLTDILRPGEGEP